MRLTVLLAILLLCYDSVSAQKCELTLEQAPELRGFKLGMTVTQARVKLPGVVFPKPDENGELTLFLTGTSLRKSDPAATGDVRNGVLTFFDGRLVSLGIGYGDSVKWDNVDEFVFTVAQSLGLPPIWPRRTSRTDDYGDSEVYSAERNLFCPGFLISVRLSKLRRPPASITMMDRSYPTRQAERRRDLEERKKSRFKP